MRRLLFSSCPRKPLPLVPPLLNATTSHDALLVPLHSRSLHSHFHRDRVILWPMRMACSLRTFCVPLRRRECVTEHGQRICDRRREQFYKCWKGTQRCVREWCGVFVVRNGREKAATEWDKCRDGEGDGERGEGVGRGDRRAIGSLERRENAPPWVLGRPLSERSGAKYHVGLCFWHISENTNTGGIAVSQRLFWEDIANAKLHHWVAA